MIRDRPNRLERLALEKALSGPEWWKKSLFRQVDDLIVTDRTDTVVGGFTKFGFDREPKPIVLPPELNGYPAAVNVEHPKLPYGGGFIVWTENGRISTLEYYSNGNERWPHFHKDEVPDFRFL